MSKNALTDRSGAATAMAIASGQIDPRACPDRFPEFNVGQNCNAVVWYETTRKLQRAVDAWRRQSMHSVALGAAIERWR